MKSGTAQLNHRLELSQFPLPLAKVLWSAARFLLDIVHL